MKFKAALPFAAAALLALAAPGISAAQEPPPAAAAAHPTYSDAQMAAFARATVEMQALGTPDADAQRQVVERSGLRVEDYNAMGDAMRNDPKLAASLNPYLDEAQAERRARLTRIPSSAASYAPPRHHSGSGSAVRHASHRHSSHAHDRHHRTAASHHAHGKKGRHGSTAHASKTRHHARSHTTTRHRRHHH